MVKKIQSQKECNVYYAVTHEDLVDFANEIIQKHDSQPSSDGKNEEIRYISRAKAAEMLGIDLSTLLTWGRKGIINSVRLGPKKVGYRLDEIVKLIKERKEYGKN